MSEGIAANPNRRQLLIGAGLIAAVVIPAGIYGIPRLAEGPVFGSAFEDPLTKEEIALISAMSEGIIPKTDTPGAIGAGVPEFIALLFNAWMLADEQQSFRKDLGWFDAEATKQHGKGFALLAPAQQAGLLEHWDDAVAKARAANQADLPPFARFKSMTVIAYYTSEVGQNIELKARMDAGQDDPNGPVMMPLPFHL